MALLSVCLCDIACVMMSSMVLFVVVFQSDHGMGDGSLCVVIVCFFFFQAEDGIRDVAVTGVQTCALPIWRGRTPVGTARDPLTVDPAWRHGVTGARPGYRCHHGPGLLLLQKVPRASDGRSEERRVGKECRSRWSPYH